MRETAKDQLDAGVGALLGACVGDAAGAVLEFADPPTATDVEWAMTMPGGGVWRVAPGQITDDCELGLSLARALSQSVIFDIERIARSYARWIESEPFDIGTTTINGLGSFNQPAWKEMAQSLSYAAAMTAASAKLNANSKSNGSLMRATPLGIWGHHYSPSDIANFARQDSCLSHPNESCWQAVACYSIAIAHLVDHLGDRQGAFLLARQWAKGHAVPEVNQWLGMAESNEAVAYEPLIGFVQIGFVHAFRHLLLETPFIDAIKETLAGGGDTDTNACIVGGLVGAAAGEGAIPAQMKEAVLMCDSSLGQPRPAFLHAGQVPALVQRML